MSERPGSCDEVAELIAIAIDGALPTRLEAHVDGCAACQDLLRDATLLGDAIRDAGDRYDHAPDFEARLIAAIESSMPPPPGPPRRIGAGV